MPVLIGLLFAPILLIFIVAQFSESKSASGRPEDPCKVLAKEVESHHRYYMKNLQELRDKGTTANVRATDKEVLYVMSQRRDFLEAELFDNKTLEQGVHDCKGGDLATLRGIATVEILSLNGSIKAYRDIAR